MEGARIINIDSEEGKEILQQNELRKSIAEIRQKPFELKTLNCYDGLTYSDGKENRRNRRKKKR